MQRQIEHGFVAVSEKDCTPVKHVRALLA